METSVQDGPNKIFSGEEEIFEIQDASCGTGVAAIVISAA